MRGKVPGVGFVHLAWKQLSQKEYGLAGLQIRFC